MSNTSKQIHLETIVILIILVGANDLRRITNKYKRGAWRYIIMNKTHKQTKGTGKKEQKRQPAKKSQAFAGAPQGPREKQSSFEIFKKSGALQKVFVCNFAGMMKAIGTLTAVAMFYRNAHQTISVHLCNVIV